LPETDNERQNRIRALAEELAGEIGYLRRYFLRQGVSVEDSEDLAQRSVLQALTRLGSFRGESALRTWLIEIARSVGMMERRYWNAKRRKGHEEPLSTDEDGVLERELLAPENPLLDALATETETLLTREIARLPPKMRRCLLLAQQGWSYREIGLLLEVTPETARSHVHQARERLRSSLRGVPEA
jgi:RNA polymerase sigma-70 factor (ECF subfamily)